MLSATACRVRVLSSPLHSSALLVPCHVESPSVTSRLTSALARRDAGRCLRLVGGLTLALAGAKLDGRNGAERRRGEASATTRLRLAIATDDTRPRGVASSRVEREARLSFVRLGSDTTAVTQRKRNATGRYVPE